MNYSQKIITVLTICLSLLPLISLKAEAGILPDTFSVEVGQYFIAGGGLCGQTLGWKTDIGRYEDYSIGAVYWTADKCRYKGKTVYSENNVGMYAVKKISLLKENMFIEPGVGLFQNQDYIVGSSGCYRLEDNTISCDSTKSLQPVIMFNIVYMIREEFYVALMHGSTAGLTDRNIGHNVIVVGVRFGNKTKRTRKTKKNANTFDSQFQKYMAKH